MKKSKLKILGLSSSQSEVGHFALILGETEGNRRLPIVIDAYQARAIALEIENIRPNRPMTHDLFVSLSRKLGYNLKEVLISKLVEGIFFSSLVFSKGEEELILDSRTSDAIALAVRFKAPIFTVEEVLDSAGIEFQDEEGNEKDLMSLEDDEEEEYLEEEIEEGELEEILGEVKEAGNDLQNLQKEMEQAIKDEDYELAAKLRDQINNFDSRKN